MRQDKSPGYNLPPSPSFSYPETPDIVAAPCHFGVKHGKLTVAQSEPQANLEADVKLVLPIETDVRINDKIVDGDTGYEYTAGLPRKIRDHHIFVLLHRTGQQEPL